MIATQPMLLTFYGQFFFSLKMKFSIQEEGKEKQIFFTFKEASAQSGLPSKVILRVLKSGQIKYERRADKKVFLIQDEEKEPFIQIDGEDFFTAEDIQERFGLSRTVFFNQLAKKKTHFLDSQEKSHEVTWKHPRLEEFLTMMRLKAADERFMRSRAQKGMSKVFRGINEGMNKCVAEQAMMF